MKETWLVTGSSVGLGRSVVEAALAEGHNVVATARHPRTLDDAERFDELAATATNIFIALGHSDGVAQAEQGRTCITQATEIGWTAPALLPRNAYTPSKVGESAA